MAVPYASQRASLPCKSSTRPACVFSSCACFSAEASRSCSTRRRRSSTVSCRASCCLSSPRSLLWVARMVSTSLEWPLCCSKESPMMLSKYSTFCCKTAWPRSKAAARSFVTPAQALRKSSNCCICFSKDASLDMALSNAVCAAVMSCEYRPCASPKKRSIVSTRSDNVAWSVWRAFASMACLLWAPFKFSISCRCFSADSPNKCSM
mmetsp:Transcript_51792/g.150586  ORF Transcript_51792/g.150586 Transcript_51792/m.150586 type:complete len:207 (+) Transcript_51792:1506-2126(+)